MIQLDLIKHIYIFSIIQATRKLKFIKRSFVHLFNNTSQILKKWLSWQTNLQYFWHLYCKFQHGSLSNGMAFQSCSVLFRDQIDLLFSCLSQTKRPNTIMTASAKVLRRNFLSNFNNQFYGSEENFKVPVFIVNRIFLGGYFFTRQPGNMPTISYQFPPGT